VRTERLSIVGIADLTECEISAGEQPRDYICRSATAVVALTMGLSPKPTILGGITYENC